MFGKSLKDRAKLMDSGIDTILRALRGERFEADGRPVYVRPLPMQRPEDIIMVGGGVVASAKRAARFGVGFGPISADLVDVYLKSATDWIRRPASTSGRDPCRSASISARIPTRAGRPSSATRST